MEFGGILKRNRGIEEKEHFTTSIHLRFPCVKLCFSLLVASVLKHEQLGEQLQHFASVGFVQSWRDSRRWKCQCRGNEKKLKKIKNKKRKLTQRIKRHIIFSAVLVDLDTEFSEKEEREKRKRLKGKLTRFFFFVYKNKARPSPHPLDNDVPVVHLLLNDGCAHRVHGGLLTREQLAGKRAREKRRDAMK